MTLRHVLIGFRMVIISAGYAQRAPMPGMPGMAGMNMGDSSGAMNDLFVIAGSDFDRPGLAPRANYSLGIGHMFKFLKKSPLGDEVTFSYMYENTGSHGF